MQELLVGLIVACAAWAVAKRYLPPAVRRLVRKTMARAARSIGWKTMAAKIEAGKTTASSSCADGCGSCDGCGPAKSSQKAATSSDSFTISVESLKATARK